MNQIQAHSIVEHARLIKLEKTRREIGPSYETVRRSMDQMKKEALLERIAMMRNYIQAPRRIQHCTVNISISEG